MDFSALTDVFTKVGAVVSNQGALLLSYALILTAVGTLAMAIVEIIKSVFFGRKWFNQWRVGAWTRDGAGRGGDAVLSELLLLAAGAHSNPRALYDQPVEKMMGQVQAAANVALEYPQEYPHLYDWLTAVPKRYWSKGASNATESDGVNWRQHAQAVKRIRALPAGAKPKPREMAAAQDASRARARLNNLVARKLDAFQNQTQYRWERFNQIAATVVSVLVFLFALWESNITAGGFASQIALALPAGVIAPFAKQLAGSLSSFRK